jgi:hypothetical protein
MTRRDKLFVALLNNPKDCRFEDACKMAELLGFVYKGGKVRTVLLPVPASAKR